MPSTILRRVTESVKFSRDKLLAEVDDLARYQVLPPDSVAKLLELVHHATAQSGLTVSNYVSMCQVCRLAYEAEVRADVTEAQQDVINKDISQIVTSVLARLRESKAPLPKELRESVVAMVEAGQHRSDFVTPEMRAIVQSSS
jgi:hypothetical protein